MPRAREGASLADLVRMATPLCQQAQQQRPRKGPGHPVDFEDWQIAVLIMVAILHKRKSKSSQYRFLSSRRQELIQWLQLPRWPARSSYFVRYRKAHRLFTVAVRLQGQKALQENVARAESVAVDKSLLTAHGPQWHKKDRKAGRIPKGLHGVDRDGTWAFSQHHGWVQGYSYEVVVTATKDGAVLPLLASADTASVSEHVSFADKIEHLPQGCRYVLADSGYDNNRYGEQIEYDPDDRRTGRRFLCPINPRNRKKGAEGRPMETDSGATPTVSQQRRRQRQRFLHSRRGRRLYRRRSQSVEPFNDWFKCLFGLEQRVWHRGSANNQTQLLAAIFCYQLLLRYNRRRGRENGQIQWILDAL